jgi:hypothetical protein
VLDRFGYATELPLRELAAKALVNKGRTLGVLGRREDAIAVCDDLITQFSSATELPLCQPVAEAVSLKSNLRKF